MSKRQRHFTPPSEPAVEVRDLAREAQVDRVRRRVAELVEGWVTREVQEVEGERRAVVIEHPSLLEQLRGGGARPPAVAGGQPASKPPARLEAVSHLREVEQRVLAWGERLLEPRFLRGVRVGAGSSERRTVVLLELLVRRAPALPSLVLDDLDEDVQRWWGAARIITTWDRPPVALSVTCIECGAFGKVQVRLDPMVAVCMECRSTWDGRSIGAMGQQVQIAMRALDEPDVVADFIDKARGRGWSGAGVTTSADPTGSLLAGLGPDRPWLDAPTSTTEAREADAVV